MVFDAVVMAVFGDEFVVAVAVVFAVKVQLLLGTSCELLLL